MIDDTINLTSGTDYKYGWEMKLDVGTHCYQPFYFNFWISFTPSPGDSDYFLVEYLEDFVYFNEACSSEVWDEIDAETYVGPWEGTAFASGDGIETSTDPRGDLGNDCAYIFRFEYTSDGLEDTATFLVLTNDGLLMTYTSAIYVFSVFLLSSVK
mmetsp:Transcript_32484/g.31738  ORF Transcript_32484/g.31738 Transcript_32484/m.31738 type:complete len:155 (-) Transcript_32484:7-471(-)